MIRIPWRGPTATKLAGTLGGSVLLQVVVFGSGVLAARGLSVSGRGQVAGALLVPPLVVQVASLGQPTAMTQFIASGQATSAAIWRAAMRNLRLQGLGALLLGASTAAIVGVSTRSLDLCIVAAAGIPALGIHHHGLAVLHGERQYGAFNVGRIAPAAMYSLLLAMAYPAGLTRLTVVAAWVVAVAASTVMTLAFCWKYVQHTTVDSQSVEKLASSVRRFGARSWISSVSPIETFRLDQLALAALGSTTALGLYTIGSSVTNVPRFAADAITAVGYAEVSAAGADRGPHQLRRFSLVGTAICAAAGLALAFLAPVLIQPVFGADYASAVPVAQVLLVSSVLISIRRIAGDAARALGFVRSAAVAELAGISSLVISLALGSAATALRMATAMALASSIAAAILWVRLRTDLATSTECTRAAAGAPSREGAGSP